MLTDRIDGEPGMQGGKTQPFLPILIIQTDGLTPNTRHPEYPILRRKVSLRRGERGGVMLWYASLSASIDGSSRCYGSGLPPRSDDSQ